MATVRAGVRALLDVRVLLVRQRRGGGGVELLLVLREEVLVDLDLGRGERGRCDKLERWVPVSRDARYEHVS